MGPGESYTGRQLVTLTNGKWLSKTAPNMGRESYLKAGLADDVMRCHYGTCDTCRVFSDVVCVTVPQMTVSVPCAITVSR